MTSEFEYVRTLLRSRAAIVLDDGKEYLMLPRLGGIASSEGLASVAELVARLRREPVGPLHWKVIEAMTTNETFFFRDQHPFDLLRTVLLPRLIERRAAERRLRIWSAACSTGQEPYSIAMLIAQHFPQLASWDVRIHATDLNSEVLARARAGRFTQLEVGRGLPASLLPRFFERHGTGWFVKDEVRRMLDFTTVNLIEPLPFARQFDVVFLRNVLVYFDSVSRDRILGRVRDVMREPSFLVLGASETAVRAPGFKAVLDGRTTYFTAAGEMRHGAH